jgi:multimeric flavodoxin WrbA
MKILALIGSPRKGGNTDILVDEVLRGASTVGHEARKLYLYDCNILPCLDCRRCKKAENGFACTLIDAMQEIYPKLEDSDLIVFGTPIYWYGPTAKMKLLIDRLRPYIVSGCLKGKKGLIVAPSEEGAACSGPLLEMFRMSFNYLEMEMAGSILAKAYDRGEIKNNPGDLSRAFDLGASLRSDKS